MKRIISLLLAVVMTIGCITVLSSCGAPKNDGAEISIYLGDIVLDFDPSDYYVSSSAEQVMSLLYEPLFKLSTKGKIECAAAKSYKVDKEERKIIIEIRESYWSDEIQLRAADFVYAWCDRIINPSNPNPAAALFADIEGVKEVMNGEGSIFDVGIKATEMQQITITYCEGADYKNILRNLASIAASPVRQDIVESAETYWSKSANSIVTNGPFKFKMLDKETGEFELSRNLGYHQHPTTKDYDNKVNPALLYTTFNTADNEIKVSYQQIEDKVTFILADAPLADREAYKKKADVSDDTSVYTYVFNTDHPLFSDPNVRIALSLMIDREAIVDAITFGKPADGFVPDACGGAEDVIISTTANETLAREYLAKANQSTVAANKAFKLTVAPDEESLAIAEIVKAAWEKLGFVVTVVAAQPCTSTIVTESGVENPASVSVIDDGIQHLIKEASYGNVQYDVIGIDWQMYSTDGVVGLAALTSDLNGYGREYIAGDIGAGASDSSVLRKNIARWSDDKYDALVSAILSTDNKKSRQAAIASAEEYLATAMPVCPLVFNQSFVFASSKISKLDFDGLGNLVFTDVKLSGYTKFYKPEEE